MNVRIPQRSASGPTSNIPTTTPANVMVGIRPNRAGDTTAKLRPTEVRQTAMGLSEAASPTMESAAPASSNRRWRTDSWVAQ